MTSFECPHCGESTFSTLCSDCLADAIPIQETRFVFHMGRCHRCGHLDDEPCLAQVGSSEIVTRAWQKKGGTLKDIAQKAADLAARAADKIKGPPPGSR